MEEEEDLRKPLLSPEATHRVWMTFDDIDPAYANDWEFAGWGKVEKLSVELPTLNSPRESTTTEPMRIAVGASGHFQSSFGKRTAGEGEEKLLGQWRATSIAGNDITSSCLYVSGICAQAAKVFAPFSLVLVCVLLYIFRGIYGEVGSALPLNGGAYNVLLNSTSKMVASLAACFTIVSYVATAVVSASSAMAYAGNLLPMLNSEWSVIGLLGFFALLNLIGLRESANVALFIFVVHVSTLILLIVVCLWNLADVDGENHFDFSILVANWNESIGDGEPMKLIFFGFSAALLGVSGFETSSNYIEQQKAGVFPKTLRNMWLAVIFFNPLLSLLSLSLLPLADIANDSNFLLARLGDTAGGHWLDILVSVDATCVLSGAVLTAYVGINGLVRRMSLDRCLPLMLVAENSLRHTNHYIIIGFFVVTSSLYLIVGGNVDTLAGVYTIAFLGVMALFAVGNMLLKYKRTSLPRDIQSTWPAVIIGFLAVIAGLIGNIVYSLDVLFYFLLYFSLTTGIVMLMFSRKRVLKILAFFLASNRFSRFLSDWLYERIVKIDGQPVVFFAKTDNLAVINKAILYVRENELTNWLKVIHVYSEPSRIPKNLELYVKLLDRAYPKMKIDLVLIQGVFNPQMVDQISLKLGVSKNFMFITCPSNRFPHNFAELGGVRLISH